MKDKAKYLQMSKSDALAYIKKAMAERRKDIISRDAFVKTQLIDRINNGYFLKDSAGKEEMDKTYQKKFDMKMSAIEESKKPARPAGSSGAKCRPVTPENIYQCNEGMCCGFAKVKADETAKEINECRSSGATAFTRMNLDTGEEQTWSFSCLQARNLVCAATGIISTYLML